ncbi:hypothetical protein Ahy_B04g072557 [Arachis hypogaea]|uniref:Aminotransferase-like plant mobile domain-containing protein n=1 Tax=Arachis hypogaea TaxID=3818 RepID=A0A444ZNA5_ARAHY|nr:hypothetical protein Ahy_B04g072557 [Arachis hypogaea]
MSEEKKAIVRDLGFGGLMHILPLRVHHQILKELANSFKLGKNRLETGYGSFKVRPRTIGAALGINASGKTLKNLTDEMMAIGVNNEQDRLMFKRIFILYIQMAFLLPTTINKIFPVHLAPIFKMDTITEGNWGAHVLNFIIKRITDYNLKKKKAIDDCLFALMIVYFHLSKNKDKKGEERPLEPWITNWTREQLVERMRAKMEEHMGIVKMAKTKEKMKEIKKKEKKEKTKKRKPSSSSSSETETIDNDVHSTFESETEEDSEDSTRKQPTRKAKRMESKKRKKIQEDSDSESESNDETQSKKKKVIVEDSSPKQVQSYHGSEIGTEELDEFLRENNEKSASQGEKEADLRSTEAHYVSSETILDVNLGSDDPSSQGHTDQSSVNKPAESMLSLVEESASELLEENIMVVREETQSEALAIVPIQVCLPLSQTTIVLEIEQTPVTENEPTPVLQIEGTTKSTPEPPQKPEESTPALPPAPSKINPAPEDVVALMMMMAQTALYVPKTDPMPSFSLGLTDSSQEEVATQEGASTQDGEMAKTPKTPKLLEQLGDLVEKIASGTNEDTSDMKEKCYIWAIRVKTYANGLTNEFDTVCTLQAQDRYILSKVHLASLAAETHIEAEIVSAMCLILNQQKIKRFQEEVYCLPPDIVNMAIANHPKGVFLRPKTNKPFRVEDYPMFIPFLDLKKLASHRYDEVDHFRVEYASQILFHEMNQDKAKAIRGSNAIRLSKPSSLLLSPYCQIDSNDIDTD